MSGKIKSLLAIKVKITWKNEIKIGLMWSISKILWIALIITGLNILSYYVMSIHINGFFNSETLKYAALLVHK